MECAEVPATDEKQPIGSTLMVKWQDEMAEKFGLNFTAVDSAQLNALRRSHGSRDILSISWTTLGATQSSRLSGETRRTRTSARTRYVNAGELGAEVGRQGVSLIRLAGYRAWLGKQKAPSGETGYPALSLMALAETGIRALIGAVFGPG